MADYKIKMVNEEEPSIAEKEQKVLENAGVEVDNNNGNYKIDLSKQKDAVQEQSADEVPVSEGAEISEEVGQEVRSTEEPAEEKEEVLELIKEDTDVQEQVQGQVRDEQESEVNEAQEQTQEVTRPELPENIQKLVDFMQETGGSLEDYVRLNTDYSNVDEKTLLREYYKQTKSHLDNDEINFLIEDSFAFDEDMDEERDIRRKKLAYKEEIAKARNFLTDLKGKYYEEVKLTSRLAPEQKEAIEFYNNYKKEQEGLTA
jgi:hypothetical protein